ncbi:MAG: DNA replication/repair protein RecF [Gammaproteobacteria bacterium]|nr:DNA replication/repair protein RecF [Gammaproteobacteria bacterium]
MSIILLRANQVRNLKGVDIEPHAQLNIIFGENASGKTSLLEAIHLLSTAKSFRTHRIQHVIQHETDKLTVFGRLQTGPHTHQLGIERSRRKTEIRVDGQGVNQTSVLTRHLPLQLITPQVSSLLEQGPKMRRRFLDWGVFHVKHDYLANWRAFHRVLQQRNAALRQHQANSQIAVWDRALVESATSITRSREAYLSGLMPILQDYSETLIGQQPELSFQQGWPQDENLANLLAASLPRDRDRGHTQYGPHRAELVFKFNGIPAQEVLSRGQTKLFISAMQLAQVSHLAREQGLRCVIMVDDLAAELDNRKRAALLDLLLSTQAQIFITLTEASLLDIPREQGHKMFHVEQGEVEERLPSQAVVLID